MEKKKKNWKGYRKKKKKINWLEDRPYKGRLKELDSFGIKMKKLMLPSLLSRSSSIPVFTSAQMNTKKHLVFVDWLANGSWEGGRGKADVHKEQQNVFKLASELRESVPLSQPLSLPHPSQFPPYPHRNLFISPSVLLSLHWYYFTVCSSPGGELIGGRGG